MGRLIDTDVFMENIVSIADLRTISTKTIGEALDKTPTVDAVPVVRCKYCEHHECYGGNIILFCHRYGMMVAPDYYCGDGNGGEQHE